MLTDFWLEKVKVGDVPEEQGVTERKLYEFVLKKELWKSLMTNSPVSYTTMNLWRKQNAENILTRVGSSSFSIILLHRLGNCFLKCLFIIQSTVCYFIGFV